MSESVSFESLNLAPAILEAVAGLGYETPSEIQAQCIPLLLEGKNVLGLAQTGTGKTAAFALPLLNNINAQENHPQILVLTPTRELAIQVAEAFEQYAKHMRGVNVLPIYGGQSYSIQLKALRRGSQIIVGTPGRLMDHLNRGTLKLDNLDALVLDEADEMLRMGFIDDVETIMAKTPEDKQTCLFSATMPKQIQSITERYLQDAEQVKVSPRNSTTTSVEQVYWPTNHVHKNDALTRFLQAENYNASIVFVRTRNDTLTLAEHLEKQGFSAAPLNGDMNQQARERTVDRLKNGLLDIVIATDVAARGLDVERIDLVVNYDIPQDSEAYVHRIGRTGRAGRTGKAVLFVKHNERYLLKNIMRHTKSDIARVELPGADIVQQKRVQAFKEKVTNVFETEKDLEFYQQLAAEIKADLEVQDDELLAALVFMAQKQSPLKVKEFPAGRPRRERNDRNDRNRRDRFEGRGRRDDRRGDDRRRGGEGRRGDNRRDRNDRGRERGPMELYRIDVGRDHGVQVKNIVGAIANEANISSRNIGDIRLFDQHSTVELPKGMPSETLNHFQRVFVCQRALKMKLA